MEILVRGTALETDEIQTPGAPPGSAIIIDRGLGECPHGFWYAAHQHDVPLLVTVLDPILVAQSELRHQLVRDIDRGRRVQHRNLLPCYGVATAGVRVLVVEAWPGGGTVREFARERRERGHGFVAEGAYTLVAHVCNGLVALHEQLVHGYVTADTVHVSDEGRVLLGAIGIGRSLPRTRGFSRFRFGGLLPNIAPEQVIVPPHLGMTTDVFGVAALFIELVTGQSVVEAGQPLHDLGLRTTERLTDCLARAIDPDPRERQPDISEFKSELAQALRSQGVRTVTQPPGELDTAARALRAELGSQDEGLVPERSAPMSIPGAPPPESAADSASGLPPPPQFPGIGAPDAPRIDPSLAGHPYPSPSGYPYPPPGYTYPPPGYAYPPTGYPPPPGYPSPDPNLAGGGYPYPPPGYPYPPPGYAYPPPGYPPPPAGYPTIGGTPPPRPAVAGRTGPDPDVARRQMDELDRATRRIEDLDEEDAIREYTERVGDGDHRFGLDDDEHDDPHEHDDYIGESSGHAILGLEVDEYEDAARRLSTLDGIDDQDTNDALGGPSDSGTFFGSLSDRPIVVAGDPPDARYYVLRQGQTYGPYPLASIEEMIRGGRVRSIDTLRHATTDIERMAVDIPMLREACEARQRRASPTLVPTPNRAHMSAVVPSSGWPPWITAAIVATLVAALGIVSWMLLRMP